MKSTAEQFFSQIKDKKVAFVGLGVSHIDTIKLFVSKGITVFALDKRSRADLGKTADDLEAAGVKMFLGDDYLLHMYDADIVMRTPGMYFLSDELIAYRGSGGIVTSEMELFFRLCPCKTIAITGSDGKTTTSTLISELLKASGKTVHLGGNIGKALLPIIFDIKESDIAVVELSSFQLLSMRLAPDTSVITNITPNHLNVHKDMAEYTNSKRNIFIHQDAFSRTVLNADNDVTSSFAGEVRGECVQFSLTTKVEHGAFLDDNGYLCFCNHGKINQLFHSSSIRIPGIHNVANYLTAICAVYDEITSETAKKVAETFSGVEHRIEFVREINGVRWYNDSIATSPTSVIAGLHAFEQKLILIAGGYDKKIPLDDLGPEIIKRVKALILLGDTAEKIEKSVTSHSTYRKGTPEIYRVCDMAQAVKKACEVSSNGDVVTLSPSSASFDMYPNFEARGRHFKELVNNLN